MSFYDRSWMYTSKAGRSTMPFFEGVQTFLDFAAGSSHEGLIKCPCAGCYNSRWRTASVVAQHLHRRGFLPGYEVWYAHGEETPADNPGSSSSNLQNVDHEDNLMFPMTLDSMGEDATEQNFSINIPQQEAPNPEAQRYLNLLEEANVPIRDKSNKTVLEHVAELMHAKVRHGLSQSAFDSFLKLQLDAMSSVDAERMPKNFYQVQKFLRTLRLPKIEIHVCVNDCALFYKDWENYNRCPYCEEPRYEVNESASGSQTIPRKKIWYFPIADRLKRLFLCPQIAANMTWHANCRGETEELIHPACGEAWKHFDRCWPQFAADVRNARLGLCTDGFNPSHHGGNYSIWPVFTTVYNLPPEICMTDPFMFMSMIIPGPRSPRTNLDVMLQPLIHDLELLWSEGTVAYDSHSKQNFILRAALLWTISDFPAYGMLSSWSTHGWLSCPYCMEKTSAFRLKHGKKICFFDCHRKFLPPNHPFRRNKSAFKKDRECAETAVERRNGFQMLEEVAKIGPVCPGKARGQPPEGFGKTHNWVQQSIFWRLPYWCTHLVRHNLDVMHVEKNVFDNILYTLLDDPGRTKDNINARMDLKILTNRRALYPKFKPNGTVALKPKSTYSVTPQQKRLIFQWVHTLNFPDGYASNLSRCFNRQTMKVSNMKSHDCHVFLQRLLTVAFADFLPPQIWEPLAELAMAFRKLCSPRILASEMGILEGTIVETICKLEKIFPPAFFDSMEHLTIHLPYEAKVCGPVQYRWMYPFERRMHVLKDYVKNPARPEGCIANAYLLSEVSNFCALYFEKDMDHCENRRSRNVVPTTNYSENLLSVFKSQGKPLGKGRTIALPEDERNTAHLYVLLNCDEVDPYVRQFEAHMCMGLDYAQTQRAKSTHFAAWFRQTITSYPPSPAMHCLATEPSPHAKAFNGYIVNGFRFIAEPKGRKGKSNCGVCVRGTSGADADPSNYYGKLQRVIQLDYHGYSVFMFMCTWYDTFTQKGIWTKPEYGLVEVNPDRQLGVYEPFILASQATQVYYTQSAGNQLRTLAGRRGWLTVISTRARHVIQGFTTTPQPPTDDETESSNNPNPAREYQDDNVPPISYAPNPAPDDDLLLTTGEFEQINLEDNPVPSNDEEEGDEQFSSDEYPEE